MASVKSERPSAIVVWIIGPCPNKPGVKYVKCCCQLQAFFDGKEENENA